MLRYIPSWEKITFMIAAIIVVQTFLKEVFGINMVGKKIYKGAPLIWKWLIRGATFRAEMNNKLDSIAKELNYNGGSSTKDMVRHLIESDKKKFETLEKLISGMTLTSLRLDINDIHSDRMIFRMDSYGACIFINDEFLKTFGYVWSEIERFNWENIIHPEDVEEVKEKWSRAIKHKSKYLGEQRIVCSDNEVKVVRVTGYPIVENGELKEFYGTVELVNSN